MQLDRWWCNGELDSQFTAGMQSQKIIDLCRTLSIQSYERQFQYLVSFLVALRFVAWGFTVEETNLMCCFDTSSRKRLIAEMKSLPINELDDEMAELLFHTVRKLEGITDEAFAQLYIAPDSMMDD